MFRTTALAALLTAGLAVPALASHCPKDAAAIDHALEVVDVSDDVKSQVMELRDKGLELHEAGNHAESEDTLAEAMRTLLNALN